MTIEQHENTASSLFFTDGFVAARDHILIAAKLNAHDEEYFSRCCRFQKGRWSFADITDSVVSVCLDPITDAVLWLGQAGTVTSKSRGAPAVQEYIADADRFGNLNRIRVIGKDVYVCGYAGQVYRRISATWQHCDRGILVPTADARSLDLHDIDGTGPDDLYVVGTNGAIFHFDGSRWIYADPPRNVHFTRIRCVQHDDVYVCGFKGTILRGSRRTWHDLTGPDLNDNLYGLDLFQNDIYVARNTGIMRLSHGKLTPVDIGIPRQFTFHRLHANDGVLWSFGTDDLLWFDGLKWTEVRHPDNPLNGT